MKKIITIFICLLVLSGCGSKNPSENKSPNLNPEYTIHDTDNIKLSTTTALVMPDQKPGADNDFIKNAAEVPTSTSSDSVNQASSSVANESDLDRSAQGLFPAQKITELMYNGKYRITLIDESKKECYLLDENKSTGCSFAIRLSSLADKWETIILNTNTHLVYLSPIQNNDLYYSLKHALDGVPGHEYGRVDLNEIVTTSDRRLKNLIQQFPQFDINSAKILNPYYIKDKYRVYYKQWGEEYVPEMIENADTKYFDVLPNFPNLAKDDKTLFFNGKAIDFKPEGLRQINASYLVNKTEAIFVAAAFGGEYYTKVTESINTINTQSIKSDFSEYIKDDKSVIFKGQVLVGADPNSFRCISPFHCLDHNTVFYGGKSIKGADPKTFRVINTFNAYDKYHSYEGDKVKS